jgi:transposase
MKNVDSAKQFFSWNDGIYKLDATSVSLSANPVPELIFFEDNPLPLFSKGTETTILNEIENKKILEGIMEAKKPSEWMNKLFNKKTIVVIIVGLAILYAIISSGGIPT